MTGKRRCIESNSRLIAKFNVCVREYRTQCLRHVTISLIDSSYGYLCNEGYNMLLTDYEPLRPNGLPLHFGWEIFLGAGLRSTAQVQTPNKASQAEKESNVFTWKA
ncbi:hypothetical protein KIN20_000475 [Parelaphostrongylus tenuis]|uniref:Uncharacterized protein n=1 Tax=Parelaphostrongylus tenuis TaxID=148309 RepID=A0AAD5QBV9_PARTN|nr:hypothetical protein KIN20_000475 [Parelaphostrongylus tenuis]